jgi:hypothetical protein
MNSGVKVIDRSVTVKKIAEMFNSVFFNIKVTSDQNSMKIKRNPTCIGSDELSILLRKS